MRQGLLTALGELSLVAAAAFLASQVAIQLVARPVALTAAAGPVAGAPPAPALDRKGMAEAVASRNLFRGRTGTAGAEEAAVPPEGPAPLAANLLGTVVDETGGRSFAIVDDNESRQQVVLFVGETFRPGTVLKSVERNRVVFLRDGREEALERLREGKEGGGGPAPAPSRASARPPDRALPGGPTINVRQTGEFSRVVDRKDADAAFADMGKIMQQVRVVPNFTEGKPDGFRLFNIRPNSVFAQLGLANGDVLRRVNGLEISGPEQALQMFTQLREASSIALDLTRANKNLSLQVEVR